MAEDPTLHRRSADTWLARGAAVWDFVDKRDIDKHVAAVVIVGFMLERTVHMIAWGFKSYDIWMETVKGGHAVSGVETAAVIAAVLGPWSIMVSAVVPFVISFYFKART